MDFAALKEKALSLPAEPGVYIMKDKTDTVIYVGKAKKLKNRVSQYFQDTASHNTKTLQMVSMVATFDVIIAATEFEALILECSLIKRFQPKYNILLKDDKGYPYIRLDLKEAYPRPSLVNKVSKDGASYYGPFGSRGVTQDLLKAVTAILQMPSCGKTFPRDIGKGRPCLYYHMGQCAGWCTGRLSAEEYRSVAEQARQLFSGSYKAVATQIKEQMLAAGNALNFELAATLRDRLQAVEVLGKKQLVTKGKSTDTDVVGYAQTGTKACFAVLHYHNGDLVDKEYEIFPIPEDSDAALSSLVKQYYLNRGFAPKQILLPFDFEDRVLFEELLEKNFERKTLLRVPQRGDGVRLVNLAVKNAQEEAQRLTNKDERILASVNLLGKMLMIEPPRRIESYDISNLSGDDIVGGMVVFVDGQPKRSAYKRFKINDMPFADDYASMEQVIRRRFKHYLDGDKGFEVAPDMILIDGGSVHAKIAESVLLDMGLSFRVLGMVKDNKHRTRALITPDGLEIRIDNQVSIFSFIGTIQEETHRFAISYHRNLRSKRVRKSALDNIPGIGPKRKEELLKRFKSIAAIKSASLSELETCLPKDAASAVYKQFNERKVE